MEVYPFVANNNNNGLSCEDFLKVSRILRSSLANPQHAIEDARSFADGVSPADKTLQEFISEIVRHSNDSCVEETRLSQINTTTETYPAQNSHDHFTRQHGEEDLKQKDICRHGKLCTHLLDLVILCMAAARNFRAKETGWNSTDKCLPADGSLDEESEKAGNSFSVFSWKMWKRGIKSVGLLRDRTSAAVPQDDKRSNKDDIDVIVENNNKDTEDKDDLKRIHASEQNGINCTEKRTHFTDTSNPSEENASPSTVEQSSENTIVHEAVQSSHISKENTGAGGTPQRKARRKLPNLVDSFLKSDLIDGRVGEGKEHLTATLKKLQLEKEILKVERNALQSETERLIKENGEIKASIRRVETEKENLTREYKQLQAQFEEHERRTRQRAFMLNTRLERLQHAKLAADQGCLKLSLKQERLVVHEQHVTLMCLRIMKTVRLELEQTHDLFNVANEKCSFTVVNSTWNEGPTDGEGLTMYEAHRRLEKQILELIKRYRTVIRLLTAAKGKDEKRSECYKGEPNSNFFTIGEGNRDFFPQYDEHFELHSAPSTESDSSCCVSIHDGVPARDIRHHESLNTGNRRAAYERRENSLTMAKNTGKRSLQGVGGHGESFTCQRNVDDKSETQKKNLFTQMPSSNDCPTSDVTRNRRNSLDTPNHGQRSCSSIVTLVTSSQTSSIETGLTKQRNTECSACRKNREEARGVKKSMSTCGRRGGPFKVHLV